MVARNLAAGGAVMAGVWLLAGPGWGLVAAGVLILALWPSSTSAGFAPLPAAIAAGRARFRLFTARVRAAPRRAMAISGLASGVVIGPAGVAVAAGAGLGLVCAGCVLAAVGLLLGWGQ